MAYTQHSKYTTQRDTIKYTWRQTERRIYTHTLCTDHIWLTVNLVLKRNCMKKNHKDYTYGTRSIFEHKEYYIRTCNNWISQRRHYTRAIHTKISHTITHSRMSSWIVCSHYYLDDDSGRVTTHSLQWLLTNSESLDSISVMQK